MLPEHWKFRPTYQEVQQEDSNYTRNLKETRPRSGLISYVCHRNVFYALLASGVFGAALFFAIQQVRAKQSLLQSDAVYPYCQLRDRIMTLKIES